MELKANWKDRLLVVEPMGEQEFRVEIWAIHDDFAQLFFPDQVVS